MRATNSTTLVLVLAVLGCGRTVYREPQSATAVDDQTFWAVGSEGFAAYFDGRGFVRRDYPLSGGVPNGSYEPGYSNIPPARVVRVEGKTVLVTRVGDFLTWTPSGWQRMPIRLPGEYADVPQIDRVLVSDRGKLAVHLHGETLLWGTLDELADGTYRKEALPNYFPWLGFAAGRLYGLGWDEAEQMRALHRYDGRGVWTIVARLGRDEILGEPRCVLSWPDGSPFVVTRYAVFDPTSPAATRPPMVLPIVSPTTTVVEQIERQTGAASVAGCYSDDGKDAVIVLYSPNSLHEDANVLVYRSGVVDAWNCSLSLEGAVVGAVRHRRGWTLITRELEKIDVPGSKCSPSRERRASVIAE